MNSELFKNNSPKLVCNNYLKQSRVRGELISNFEKCDRFALSVAFLNDSGIRAINQTLLDIKEKGTPGRIVTSTYLGFNSPKTFRILHDLFEDSKVEVRIYKGDGFHPKGYLFGKEDKRTFMIGSSNLTQNALCKNQEWNISLNAIKGDEIAERIESEFEEQWDASEPLTLSWIEEYELDYRPPVEINNNNKKHTKFEPNKMQTEALINLADFREKGIDKALLISATGTGKTFLSAFDVRQMNAEKCLFVVHRETIASKARETFNLVMPDKTTGMYTGGKKESADFLFSTVNTLSKKEHHEKFARDEFDYIIIDEVHRAGANMYKKIFEYFKPKFLLGMSATPERTDDPKKIFELFDYNIAYEIRLKQAMEYDLLCPFHYFGIADLNVDGKPIDDKTEFNSLVSTERVKHILKAIKTYGYSGDKPHGLIFVSRREEAERLSYVMNISSNYKTTVLDGNSSDVERKRAIDLLEEEDTSKEYLDYIFTVDLFNEGVDIPCLNQVLMLRSTKSSIIFIQQLGRGLRKHKNKEYVNVIDFIGNYENNFLIPVALSGDTSGAKDGIRQFMHKAVLPGASTVSFDSITKNRIYNSIDKAKLNSITLIKDAYNKLKARLANKIPTLMDFDKYDSMDPIAIVKQVGSYHNFLKKYESDYPVVLEKDAELFVEFVSKKFMAGKRIQELELIKQTILKKKNVFLELGNSLINNYGKELKNNVKNTLINEMTGNFSIGSEKEKFADVVFIKNAGADYDISEKFADLLKNKDFYNTMMEIVEFGIYRYKKDYSETYMDTDLVLYKKYTYDDVYRLLNWEKAENAQNVGGYKYDKYSNTFPVFINYDKSEAEESVQYEDDFKDHRHIVAISKNKRRVTSPDAVRIAEAKKNGTQIHLFVRKNKVDDVKEFYYLGLVDKKGEFESVKTKTGENVFTIPYELETSVREDIFSYICDK
ncbi:MAG: DUF3427 domain-containing protein [Erysipelotrichaceae bacterium]|nr:DUF3427 domain-containing protein [Erysipelotrichaceae bacterium]